MARLVNKSLKYSNSPPYVEASPSKSMNLLSNLGHGSAFISKSATIAFIRQYVGKTMSSVTASQMK